GPRTPGCAAPCPGPGPGAGSRPPGSPARRAGRERRPGATGGHAPPPTAQDWASRRPTVQFAPSCVHGSRSSSPPSSSPPLPARSLAACAGQPVPPATEAAPSAPSQEREQLAPAVADISTKAEALLRAQDELVWKYWTEGVAADLAKTYVGTEAWLTPDAVARVARLRDLTTEPRERRALEHLHAD